MHVTQGKQGQISYISAKESYFRQARHYLPLNGAVLCICNVPCVCVALGVLQRDRMVRSYETCSHVRPFVLRSFTLECTKRFDPCALKVFV